MELHNNLPGSKIEKIRWLIEPVYRYHLARSENYLEAQNLTTHTLRSAIKGVDTHGNTHELITWIMGIARYQQAFGRRHLALIHQRFVEQEKTHVPGGLEYLESPAAQSLVSDSYQQDQDQILLRDQMTHLSSSWKHLPRVQADALALYFFGGLSLSEIGKILKKNENDVKRLVSSQLPFEKELVDLAESIHPGNDFVTELLALLERDGANHLSFFKQRIEPAILHPHGPWRTIYNSSGRFARFGLMASVLIVGLFVILHQSAAGSPPSDPPGTPLATEITSWGTMNNPGNLVPPSTAFCEQWQKALEDSIGLGVSISMAAYYDPTQLTPDVNGTGCQLAKTVTDYTVELSWPAFDKATSLMLANHFTETSPPNSYLGYNGSSYFGQGCFGMARTFASSSNLAVVTVSWCPSGPAIQGNATAAPPTRRLNSASQGGIAYYMGPYMLTVTLASNAVETMIDDMVTQWAKSNVLVFSYMSPEALKSFPTLASLDRFAGINRSPGQQVAFSWQVTDNSGTEIRIQVNPRFLEIDGTGGTANQQFQMVWSQSNGVWTIKELGIKTRFP